LKPETKVNTALQFLHISGSLNLYLAVDYVFTILSKMGLPYEVCRFEMVVEGTTSECSYLIKSILEKNYTRDFKEFLLNTKFRIISLKDGHITYKTYTDEI
jgi:uncharacterized protein YqgV (UPF0045/DUF77 family)